MNDTELKELIEDCCNEIANKIEPLANVKARLYTSLKPAINYTRCSTELPNIDDYNEEVSKLVYILYKEDDYTNRRNYINGHKDSFRFLQDFIKKAKS
jgi:hypothetical protein